MALLTRTQILEAADLKKQVVEVPEWGGEVMVRSLTGTERDRFEGSVISFKGKNQQMNLDNLRSKLCVMTICDEEGNLLFSEKDIAELGRKSATALDRVFQASQDLSGLTEEAVQELIKN